MGRCAEGELMDTSAIPQLYRATYQRAMSGRSRKAAIRAHCLMCVDWQYKAVVQCTAPDCPLYPYRLARESALEPPDLEGDASGSA